MRVRLRSAALLLTLAALASVALACDDGNGGSSTATPGPLPEGVSGGIYLALGDSIAAGSGASEPDINSYVALVTEALRSHFGEELELRSLAEGGHTTEDLIEEQLPAALESLREGNVRVVTVTISGNDLQQYSLAPACVVDPSDPACPLEDGLLEVEQRLDRILSDLRAAGPDTVIVIQAYPDLFSGTGHELARPAEIAFGLLNGVIVAVAERQDVLLADPRRAFLGRSGDLGHILDPTPDFHPNDDGHRAIADAFIEVLGLSGDAGEE